MIARGVVCWLEPDPAVGSEQAGRRPCVVVSRNAINLHSPVVIVVPLTTFRGQPLYPSDVLLEPPEGGLKQASVALGLHVRAVDKRRLGTELGRLTRVGMRRLEWALLQVLDISASADDDPS